MSRRDRRRRPKSQFVPVPMEVAQTAALKLVRELVVARQTGDPMATAGALRELFAITNDGVPTMKDVIIYLADLVADGIYRGYGDNAVDEVNRVLSAVMLKSTDSTDSET